MAKKHQMLAYLSLKEDSVLIHANLKCIGGNEMTINCLRESDKELFHQLHIDDVNVFMSAKAVLVEGQNYVNGEYVVIRFMEDEYVFGEISNIFVINDSVYLLCHVMKTECFNSHIHAYTIQPSFTNELIRVPDLLDYHPVAMYNFNGAKHVVLRYFVPMSND